MPKDLTQEQVQLLSRTGGKDFGSRIVDGVLVPINPAAQSAFVAFIIHEATRPLHQGDHAVPVPSFD